MKLPLPWAREAAALLLITSVAALSLTAFAWLDRRPPNDHDDYFTHRSLGHLAQLQATADPAEERRILRDHFLTGGPHPRLAQTLLIAQLDRFGTSRFVYRMVNLPFLLALILGTWLLARQLGGPGMALLAVVLVLSVPVMVHHGRKFNPPFFTAALTPLSWALFLLALRVKGGWGWAAAGAAGLVQGARCYTHPVVQPDIAASTALVTLWALGLLAWRRDRGSLIALLRVAFAGLLALGLASHILGVNPWLPEPGYSVRNYLSAKAQITRGGTGHGLLWGAAKHGREWWSTHLLPTGALLLLTGLGAAVRRGLRERDVPSGVALLLGIAFVPQAVLATLTVARGTFTSDWNHLVPGLCVVAAWGALGGSSGWGRPARLWATGLGLHAAFVLITPFALSALGPPTSVDPGWTLRGVAAPFARSSTGLLFNTHLIPVRDDLAGQTLARAMNDGPPMARVLDLRWTGPADAARCRGEDGDGIWLWGAPRQAPFHRVWFPWPAVFEGRMPVAPEIFSVDDSLLHDPVAIDAALHGWVAQIEPGAAVVARLWIDQPPDVDPIWRPCQPSHPAPALVDRARAHLAEHLPGCREETLLWDLGGELMGVEDERTRDVRYLNTALLLRCASEEGSGEDGGSEGGGG
mgnify:CR=1 FL=1